MEELVGALVDNVARIYLSWLQLGLRMIKRKSVAPSTTGLVVEL